MEKFKEYITKNAAYIFLDCLKKFIIILSRQFYETLYLQTYQNGIQR